MSDDTEKAPESLEEQLKSMLKQANLSFVMPGQVPEPATVTPEPEQDGHLSSLFLLQQSLE